MPSTDMLTTLPFITVATGLWYVSSDIVDFWVSATILVGIGVLAPTIITEYW